MRYFVFAGQNYYPFGGAHDYVGVYEDLNEAKLKALSAKYDEDSNRPSDWGHVFDSVEGEIIFKVSHGVEWS